MENRYKKAIHTGVAREDEKKDVCLNVFNFNPADVSSYPHFFSPKSPKSISSSSSSPISSFENAPAHRHRFDSYLSDTSSENDAISLSPKVVTPPKFKLAAMNADEMKYYIMALLCRAAESGTAALEELLRFALAVLSGAQLSGILKCNLNTSLSGIRELIVDVQECYVTADPISLDLQCQVQPSVQLYDRQKFSATLPPQSIEDIFNHVLFFNVDTMTYGALGGWIVAHTLAPPLRKCLLNREEAFMRRVIESQNRRLASDSQMMAPLRSRSKVPCTAASIVSFVLEYFMPVLKGVQYAIALRGLQNISNLGDFPLAYDGSANFNYYDSENTVDMEMKYFSGSFNLSKGAEPTPDFVLWTLMAVGFVIMGIQAFCNFHHDLQTKEVADQDNNTLRLTR